MFFHIDADPACHGTPTVAEPSKCVRQMWAPPDDLPQSLLRYTEIGIDLFRSGHTYAAMDRPDDATNPGQTHLAAAMSPTGVDVTRGQRSGRRHRDGELNGHVAVPSLEEGRAGSAAETNNRVPGGIACSRQLRRMLAGPRSDLAQPRVQAAEVDV